MTRVRRPIATATASSSSSSIGGRSGLHRGGRPRELHHLPAVHHAAEPGRAELTEAERTRLEHLQYLKTEQSGYAMIQITRPQTLAHGLHDSPVGQLAWIVEKFKEWTDPATELPEDAVDRDLLLTNVMLYWLTGTAGSSANSYYETAHAGAWGASERSTVPTGVAVFPLDVSIRRTVELEHTVVHWSEFGRGGHFAAMEAPDLLVDDVRKFFSKLR